MSEIICVCTGLFGRAVLLDLDQSLVRHVHPYHHILFNLGGANSAMVVEEAPVPLTEERAVFIDSWTPHSYNHAPGQPKTRMLALYIHPAWLASFRPSSGCAVERQSFAGMAGQISPIVRSWLKQLESEMISDRFNYVVHGRMIVKLLDGLFQASIRSTQEPALSHTREVAIDWRIRKAMTMLRQEGGSALRIDDLIAKTGMSRAHFFRRFEAETGVTPGLFQNALRLERAFRLTADGKSSIGAISEMLGFASQAHFTRFFRNHAAVPPTQLRRALSHAVPGY